MNCPKCVGILQEKKIGSKDQITVDACFACGGIWFDKNELDLLINKKIFNTVEFDLEAEPLPDNDLKKEIDLDKKEAVCPHCENKNLVKKISERDSKVTIDYCQNCGGIWLDGGEFKKISKTSPIEEKIEKVIDFFRLHFPRIFKDRK